MKPSDISSALRRIASAIDNSRNPSRELVSRDISNLIHRLSAPVRLPQTDNEEKAEQIMFDVTRKCTFIFDSIKQKEQIPSNSVQILKNALKLIGQFKFHPSDVLSSIQKKCEFNFPVLINCIDLADSEGIPIDDVIEATKDPLMNLLALSRELGFGSGRNQGQDRVLALPKKELSDQFEI